MKILILSLLSVVASAGKPQVTVSIRDGSYAGLDCLEPTVTWEGSKACDDKNVDLSFGLESAIPSSSTPIWAKASTRTGVLGWGLSARADMDVQNASDGADLILDANHQGLDLSLQLTGSTTAGVAWGKITKGLDIGKSRVTVTPSVNKAGETDVEINYSDDLTAIKLTASMETKTPEIAVSRQIFDTQVKVKASVDAQELAIAQQIGDNDRIASTISNSGAMSVEWKHRIGDDSSMTAKFKPHDSLNIKWRENAWTANIDMPMDGARIDSTNVNISRDISF
jgi:hypothetical protein